MKVDQLLFDITSMSLSFVLSYGDTEFHHSSTLPGYAFTEEMRNYSFNIDEGYTIWVGGHDNYPENGNLTKYYQNHTVGPMEIDTTFYSFNYDMVGFSTNVTYVEFYVDGYLVNPTDESITSWCPPSDFRVYPDYSLSLEYEGHGWVYRAETESKDLSTTQSEACVLEPGENHRQGKLLSIIQGANRSTLVDGTYTFSINNTQHDANFTTYPYVVEVVNGDLNVVSQITHFRGNSVTDRTTSSSEGRSHGGGAVTTSSTDESSVPFDPIVLVVILPIILKRAFKS